MENSCAHGVTAFVAMETAYSSNIQSVKEHKDFWLYLNEKYKPIAVNDHYFIFDLRVPKEVKNDGTAIN